MARCGEGPTAVTFALACSVVLSLAAGWALWLGAAAQPIAPTPEPIAVPALPTTEAEGVVAFAGSGSLTITDGRAMATVGLSGGGVCPLCSRSLSEPAGMEVGSVVVLWDRSGGEAFRGCYDCLIAAVTSHR